MTAVALLHIQQEYIQSTLRGLRPLSHGNDVKIVSKLGFLGSFHREFPYINMDIYMYISDLHVTHIYTHRYMVTE